VICRDRAGAYAYPRELHQTGVFALVAWRGAFRNNRRLLGSNAA
jgi:hypothetical protein